MKKKTWKRSIRFSVVLFDCIAVVLGFVFIGIYKNDQHHEWAALIGVPVLVVAILLAGYIAFFVSADDGVTMSAPMVLHSLYLTFPVGLLAVGFIQSNKKSSLLQGDFGWLLVAFVVCIVVEVYALWINAFWKVDDDQWFMEITAYPLFGFVFYVAISVDALCLNGPGLLGSPVTSSVMLLLSGTYLIDIWKTGQCAARKESVAGGADDVGEMMRKVDLQVHELSETEKKQRCAEAKSQGELLEALKKMSLQMDELSEAGEKERKGGAKLRRELSKVLRRG